MVVEVDKTNGGGARDQAGKAAPTGYKNLYPSIYLLADPSPPAAPVQRCVRNDGPHDGPEEGRRCTE